MCGEAISFRYLSKSFNTMHFKLGSFDSTGIATVTSEFEPEESRSKIGRYVRERAETNTSITLSSFFFEEIQTSGEEFAFFDIYVKASTACHLSPKPSSTQTWNFGTNVLRRNQADRFSKMFEKGKAEKNT